MCCQGQGLLLRVCSNNRSMKIICNALLGLENDINKMVLLINILQNGFQSIQSAAKNSLGLKPFATKLLKGPENGSPTWTCSFRHKVFCT